MPETVRAHAWTFGILAGAIALIWFLIAFPKVILWVFLLVLAAALYYVLYLVVRARIEMIDTGQ